jgi:two-component system response regulator CpxR
LLPAIRRAIKSQQAIVKNDSCALMNLHGHVPEAHLQWATVEAAISSAGARLLVVDDDVELCELVSRFLGSEGFRVDAVHSGAAGVEGALGGGYALVLLDVMLGRTNGFNVLRQIRATSAIPVVMLTAKGDTLARVLGLEIGADDYLPKPFDPPELAARIRAVLRRSASNSIGPTRARIVVEDLELDPGARAARRGGQPIELTTVEFDLLEALAGDAGHVISRESLVTRVLGRQFSPFDSSVNTHIYNLRRKLGPAAGGGERIVGIRGIGYLYACSSKSSFPSG